MFNKSVYTNRRSLLRKRCKGGILFFPGNNESPMNYAGNTYRFRQDSNFLYFFGIDLPGLAATIDLDSGDEIIYGTNPDIDDIIWMGNQPLLSDTAAKCGVTITRHFSELAADLRKAKSTKRSIRILPTYRSDQQILIASLLEIPLSGIKELISEDFIRAVIALREIKENDEIEEIESAVGVAYKMHTQMMTLAKPGVTEYEIAGVMEGIAASGGGAISFPVILSIDGQILHNHSHNNILKEGRMLVADAGCETSMHYASDITRSVPVGGRFSVKQKEIYEIVLDANMAAIRNIKPGILNKDLHMIASTVIASGLKSLGLMKGDTGEAIHHGAHALFFPHGLGHMMGLDVHDMESLGENYIGYDDTIKRSTQFGTAYLRLAKKLKPGFVFTIEPGIYFIPALIDLWKAERRFEDFIDYAKVDTYREFGGIRIEDDVLVTDTGGRVLGRPIPKSVSEIEEIMTRQNS